MLYRYHSLINIKSSLLTNIDNRLCKEQHIAPPPPPKKSKGKSKVRKGSRPNGKTTASEDIKENNSNNGTIIWETVRSFMFVHTNFNMILLIN